MADAVAWLFPGQGSQSVGMGQALAASREEAAEAFSLADRTLGISVSQLCWEGPAEELTRTANQQPALVTTSIAMQRVLSADGRLGRPDFVAGHSLGEYSALVAAGAIDLADALRLVRRRGELMEQHGLGGMVAIIGLDDESAQLLANETGTEVANFNSPGQVTLSGTDDALAVAEMAASTRGARRVVRLPVNGAFHSSLMQPVAEELAPMIGETRIETPIAPLVTNVDATAINHPDDIRRELVDQIARSVQWVRVVEHMVSEGVSQAFEIGPGNVLAGLARRIDRSLTVKTADQLLAETEPISG
ncbi:MAG: ACP S-malonyltransferase [Thermomicrobiales bacterium]